MDLTSAFLAQSREYLTAHYLPKIRAAVEQLDEADLWWRPNEQSNSIGNLMLHLAGNVRQWVVSGVGGAPDVRDRPAEFARREPLTRAQLLATLTAAVQEADATVAGSAAQLGEHRSVQGRDVTGFEVIYHVVEHFAMHTGQIIFATKMLTGVDLELYKHLRTTAPHAQKTP